MSDHPAPDTLLGQPKEPLVPQLVRPRGSLHIHVLCVWKKSINNIASYTMHNILIQNGLAFVVEEETCFDISLLDFVLKKKQVL